MGPDPVVGDLLFAGLTLLALALFLVAIRVGRWSVWLAAYLVAALAVASTLPRRTVPADEHVPARQRSDGSGVRTGSELPRDAVPGRTYTVEEEAQRVDATIPDPGGKPA